MKKIALFLASLGIAWVGYSQPCSTTNGTNCLCADGTTNCELLPDLMISWAGMQSNGGPTEYSQTGNGVENGRLRITGSTPNIGYGAFTVMGSDYFLCGTDTIYDPSQTISTCSGGDIPTNLLKQRIYSKNGNTVTYTDRWAGGQTFHPGHGHNHVDDWVSFTLRVEDPNEPDTLQWPILGSGAKIGFCLMDLSNCSGSYGHCRDGHVYNTGTILDHNTLPNFGMGGGTYSCSPILQGISAGYVDIYDQMLEGMWIDIPPGTCNGNYWIVAQVDPRNNFRESNENNNWTAIPFTLTRQVPQGSAAAVVDLPDGPYLCNGNSVTLSAIPGQSYIWSTGATTASIKVSQPGDYFVEVNGQCGSAVSDTITIDVLSSTINNTEGDTICLGGNAVVTANGAGIIDWFDSPIGGASLSTGGSYVTGAITQNTTLYAQNTSAMGTAPDHVGPTAHSGTAYGPNNEYGFLTFDAWVDFTLLSVKVYTDVAAVRTIQLTDWMGNVLADTAVYIPVGTHRIGLDFDVPMGYGYMLTTDFIQNFNVLGYESPRLRRSDNGVGYPYEVPNVVSISGSSDGVSYYYFYDWEVTTTGYYTCPSPRIPVEIVIEQHTNITFPNLDAAYTVTDAAIQLTASITGGDFSGRGVTTDGNGNAYFSPALAGIDDSIAITYQYTTPRGCSADTVMYVTVLADSGTGITELADNRLLFYPNPALNSITIALPSTLEPTTLTVLDATGKKVLELQLPTGGQRYQLDISPLSKGIYFLRLDGNSGSKYGKLSKL